VTQVQSGRNRGAYEHPPALRIRSESRLECDRFGRGGGIDIPLK
jgi:hypothetical protein